jgi:hypothetical protein
MAALDEVVRHRTAHDSESNKSDFHNVRIGDSHICLKLKPTTPVLAPEFPIKNYLETENWN